jgi:hypothetical protein
MALSWDYITSIIQKNTASSSTGTSSSADQTFQTLFSDYTTNADSETSSEYENKAEDSSQSNNNGLIYSDSDTKALGGVFSSTFEAMLSSFKSQQEQNVQLSKALAQVANTEAALKAATTACKKASSSSSSTGKKGCSSKKSSCSKKKSSCSKKKSSCSKRKSNASGTTSTSSSTTSTTSTPSTNSTNSVNSTNSTSSINTANSTISKTRQSKNVSASDATKISALKSKFDSTYSQSAGMQNASNSDINGMYNEYISCESLVEMYKASGDTSYMDKAIQLCDAYIAAGKDLNGDGYLDWKASVIPQGYNHDHYEWRAADGVAMVVNQLMTDPELKNKYSSQASKYSSFIEKNVWEKWNNTTGRCGSIKDVPTEEHFIARIGTIALNMYEITGDQKYLNWIKKEVPALKSAIEKSGDIEGTINGGSIDSGHAADTVDFIVDCYKAGLIFDSGDISTLVSACKKRGNPPGWVKLAEFDSSLYSSYSSQLNGSLPRRTAANIIGNLAGMLVD